MTTLLFNEDAVGNPEVPMPEVLYIDVYGDKYKRQKWTHPHLYTYSHMLSKPDAHVPWVGGKPNFAYLSENLLWYKVSNVKTGLNANIIAWYEDADFNNIFDLNTFEFDNEVLGASAASVNAVLTEDFFHIGKSQFNVRYPRMYKKMCELFDGEWWFTATPDLMIHQLENDKNWYIST